MKKVQIQLPDPLARDLQKITEQLDISLAELLRRGAEYMRRCYKGQLIEDAAKWQPPQPRKLGSFQSNADTWREIANRRES